jgi:hypothetical protein
MDLNNYDASGNQIVRDPITGEIIGTRADHTDPSTELPNAAIDPNSSEVSAPSGSGMHVGLVAILVAVVLAAIAYFWFSSNVLSQPQQSGFAGGTSSQVQPVVPYK